MSLDLGGRKSIEAEINVRKLNTLYVGHEAEKLAKSLMKNKILKPIVFDFHEIVKKLTSMLVNTCIKNNFIGKESPSDLTAKLRNYVVDSL